jgi:hypothetical protein
LLFRGADYLLTGYFLPHLKPKGALTETEKKRLLMCALQTANLNCLQIVMDELLNLKGAELKNTILKYGLCQAVARNENPTALLWLLRKKIKAVDGYTMSEVESMMGLKREPRFAKYPPLLAYLAHKQQSPFYKEFFHDFLFKQVLKENAVEYKNVISKILLFPRSSWNVPLEKDEEDMNLLFYCLNYPFLDVIQTFCQTGMSLPEDQKPQIKECKQTSLIG